MKEKIEGEQLQTAPQTTFSDLADSINIALNSQLVDSFHEVPDPDLDQARRFLNLLDPNAAEFVFQTFDDNKARGDKHLVRTVNSTFDNIADMLAALNQRGAGVFVTVNHSSNGGRKKADIDGFRVIFREADKPNLPALPLTPHITVETSPGKSHEYLLLDPTEDGEGWDRVMMGMVEQYGSDPNAKDRSRVLRLPGFFHLKDPSNPHMVRIIAENSHSRYSIDDLSRHIQPVQRTARVEDEQEAEVESRYGQAALEKELEILATTQEGGRNNQLNTSAFSLGQLVGGGELDRSIVEEELLAVAMDIGLPEGEAERTIKSGLDSGEKHPRTAPGVATVATVTVADWETPKSLVVDKQSDPYPLEHFPDIVGDAVREVVGFVQCPTALAGCSALSALSIVGQGLVDVRRAEGLEGPSSLFLLAVAESGERKTSIDSYFSKIISAWENEQAENAKPLVKIFNAAHDAWEAKRNGILARIKQLATKGASTHQQEQDLATHERSKPTPPPIPRLLFGDTTPEALSLSLARVWPSSGVMSSEAGVVFGSHAMNKDSIMRNISMLNSLWGGETLKVDRKNTESFIVQGARLTMGLAVQPGTIRAFIDSTKGLARGSGFLARFLITCPESTQGDRLFRDPPPNWPCLDRFNKRMVQLLDIPLKLNEQGGLSPVLLELSPEAKKEWVTFHDEVEKELKRGGEMADLRDVASKAADNAARLAALFHVFEVGVTGMISEKHMISATYIVAWHLFEALRFINKIGHNLERANALALDAWLIKYCRASGVVRVSTRDIQRYGPNCVRDKGNLDLALEELTDTSRVRVVKEGKKTLVEINPAILGGISDSD